ncbi:MAG: hypothetical protein SFY69_06910 [Planctomycetota bacterium]|nr:hypothetical protein [Planctomycetota bacterium]
MFNRIASVTTTVLLASVASAAVTGVAGQATLVGAPPIANFPPLSGPNAFVWDEQQNSSNSAGTLCDMTLNPSSSVLPTPGPVFGPVDSHFIHIANFTGTSTIGTVFYSNPIIGVIYNDQWLDISDIPLGAPGTAYPTGQPLRGMQAGVVQINANVLRFDIPATPGAAEITQIRVLTRPVPTPGALALAGLGGIVAVRRRRGA